MDGPSLPVNQPLNLRNNLFANPHHNLHELLPDNHHHSHPVNRRNNLLIVPHRNHLVYLPHNLRDNPLANPQDNPFVNLHNNPRVSLHASLPANLHVSLHSSRLLNHHVNPLGVLRADLLVNQRCNHQDNL